MRVVRRALGEQVTTCEFQKAKGQVRSGGTPAGPDACGVSPSSRPRGWATPAEDDSCLQGEVRLEESWDCGLTCAG